MIDLNTEESLFVLSTHHDHQVRISEDSVTRVLISWQP